MIARILLDRFLETLTSEKREEAYQLAYQDLQLGLAKLASLYHELFNDFPSGDLILFLEQHLKDRLFQKKLKEGEIRKVA